MSSSAPWTATKGVAEAPGKVIISGEHFVVHGATALSAAIERKVRVEASRAPALKVESSIRSPVQLAPVKKLVESLYKARDRQPSVNIAITSDIAEGSGLGSSAATMVATTAAIAVLEEWAVDQAFLIQAAETGEKLVHGNPSGIDATTSAMGGVLTFKKGQPPRALELQSSVRLLVAYSGQRRDSGRLIRKVGEMKDTYPSLFASLCDSATIVSNLCARALAKGDLPLLGSLMTYNHAVLARAGASNDKLDRLVDLCLRSDCLGAKLTGAGGGGSVVAVPPQDPQRAEDCANKLKRSGFGAFFTTLPAEGVRSWRE
ncbi:MAG TPA: mevalonate kinase [Nitrososphaerales archaeon]|nr:mevalonate kinase [Nitrososphaerales archaeon]